MASVIANSNYNILYDSNIVMQLDNIANKNIVAYKDSNSNLMNLTLGASSNIEFEAIKGLNVFLNSNNSFNFLTHGNGSNIEILKIEKSNSIGVISSSNQAIIIKGLGDNLETMLSLTNIKDSNYSQVLSTIQSNFVLLSPVVFSSNSEWENHVYTTNFNMYKNIEPTIGNSNLSQVAYTFYIDDYDQLQLVQFNKYGTSNTSSTIKSVNVFGAKTNSNLQKSAANSYKGMYFFNNMPLTVSKLIELTSCGANLELGPTAAQMSATYGSSYSSLITIGAYDGYQVVTLPESTQYTITCYGASGGTYYGSSGKGAIMKGVFSLNAGDKLIVIVGQKGRDVVSASLFSPSGGGGTFVVLQSSQSRPLICSGGGAANSGSSTVVTLPPSAPAVSDTNPATGSGFNVSPNVYSYNFTNSFQGNSYPFGYAYRGGFGGGGASGNGNYGGGGGYIGGAASSGGTSYVNTTLAISYSNLGTWTGNGKVIIEMQSY